MFQALGRLVYRRWRVVLALAAAFLLGALALLARGGILTTGLIHGLESERAQEGEERVLGYPSEATFIAIFQSPDLDPEGDDFAEAMDQALAPLRAHPGVREVATPQSAPPFLAESLVSPGHHAAAALITLRGVSTEELLAAYPPVRAALRSDKLAITCTGMIPFIADLKRTLHADLLRAELLSLPLALLVLLLVFRTAVAALLPVLVGGLSVLGGVAVVFALSRRMEVAEYTVNVCSLMGLGVAIDYSLFTVSRYREELAAGRSYQEALVTAVATAGRVVAFSGLAVGTGLAGLLFFRGSYLEGVGLGGAVVVGLAALCALTVLPAVLAGLGPRIHSGRLPFLRALSRSGAWRAVADWVMARPLWVLLPTLGLLLLMGVPFLRLQMSVADVSVLHGQVEARAGDDLLRAEFPDLALARQAVVVHFPSAPALTAERIGALYDLSRRVARLPHVKRVESLVDRPGSEQPSRAAYQELLLHPPPLYAAQIEQAKRLTVGAQDVLLFVLSDAPRGSEAAREVVRGIRAVRAVGDGELLVGGHTAIDVDTAAYMAARTGKAVAFVVAVMLAVLFLLLRSVVLPLKAVAMNFVSIAGSFGALVWVFQEGHLFVKEPRPIETTLPTLLFCVLFGLSMDYEVLMLSRMKELYERTRDNRGAVAEGLERSAGLITSAAAIMVAVFSAFSLARVVLIQAVGFGMALAVALDATLVRVLLVPATMRLFGDLNWWAPAPLVRLLDRLGLKHQG